MTRFDLIDDGFVTLEVRKKDAPPEAGSVSVTLDTFEVFNALRNISLAEIDAAEKENRVALTAEKNRDWLNEKFNLGCSAKFADDLFRHLKAEVQRIQKKDLSPNSAETPRPTDSPFGPTTAEPTHLG